MKHFHLNRPAAGFTLIELMITVAIVGVLSAVAFESYTKNVLKSQRSVAKGVLMQNAQFLERYNTTKGDYAGGTLSSATSPKDVAVGAVRYNITNTISADGSTFLLKATPTIKQAADECGTLTLSNTGVQGPTTPADCW
ncbi:prepilin-type N-terminal cleavage/methylation domain-containing protein [Massilia sp. CCM 8695]|uniref:Prepilin-type N-terminal cleavage/methylation domain-containing protein n=1 Tax=Massilia frigida TaxID=2609281 RepID=A0ABX0N2R7_9BURK|nr:MULTISPECIES: type IV pilin protein [Massilia]MDM5177504.1 type IV pilin protein [Massilia sp. DJPM01]NHZ79347.1 prepilin-type N-terminal cleavage/methylation domain-containing protein [Massilia frigida]